MIELDYAPLAVLLPISLAFVAPVIYSFFVDHTKKDKNDHH